MCIETGESFEASATGVGKIVCKRNTISFNNLKNPGGDVYIYNSHIAKVLTVEPTREQLVAC